MRDFSPNPEELFRDPMNRVQQVKMNIPKQVKIFGLPIFHLHSKANLNRQLNVATDSKRQVIANAELELKYGCPPDYWLRDLRVSAHNFHVDLKDAEDKVYSRPNLPADNLLQGISTAAKIVAPSVFKGFLGKSEQDKED